jgi:hypothetical protein
LSADRPNGVRAPFGRHAKRRAGEICFGDEARLL